MTTCIKRMVEECMSVGLRGEDAFCWSGWIEDVNITIAQLR